MNWQNVCTRITSDRLLQIRCNDECFYLRLLLLNVPGPTSFQFLRNVDDELCAKCREACQRLHLLKDDVHWDR